LVTSRCKPLGRAGDSEVSRTPKCATSFGAEFASASADRAQRPRARTHESARVEYALLRVRFTPADIADRQPVRFPDFADDARPPHDSAEDEQLEPDGDKTLEGRPKTGSELWHDPLRPPLGFHLSADGLEHPAGMLGDNRQLSYLDVRRIRTIPERS
jgi:hypothetical protein